MRIEVLTAVGVAEVVGLVEQRPCRQVTVYRRRQGYLILTGPFDPGNEGTIRAPGNRWLSAYTAQHPRGIATKSVWVGTHSRNLCLAWTCCCTDTVECDKPHVSNLTTSRTVSFSLLGCRRSWFKRKACDVQSGSADMKTPNQTSIFVAYPRVSTHMPG